MIILAGNSSSGEDVVIGAVLTLLGALGYGTAGLLVRYLSLTGEPFDMLGIMAAQFLCGGVLLLPYLFLSGDLGASDWGSAELWSSIAFIVIGAQVLAFLTFYSALVRWPSSRVYPWAFLAPVVAILIEAFRGNLPGASSTLGMAVVVVGIVIVNLPAAEAKPSGSGRDLTSTSPRLRGSSILITSAPRSASCTLPHGPAPYCSIATIVTSSSGGAPHAAARRRRYSMHASVVVTSAVAPLAVEQVRVVRALLLVAHAVLGHEREEAVRERVDDRRADAARGRAAGDDHGVDALRVEERRERRAGEDRRPLLRDHRVGRIRQALVDLDPRRADP